MAEEEKKSDCKADDCRYTACAMNWLKIVDDWSIAGWNNTFPRLYYVVAGLLILFVLI